ncbi:ATP-binding protein [candidate division KSB1 bacterium]|nr:ATP-binding protein [candidate division KSB1 bacterium]
MIERGLFKHIRTSIEETALTILTGPRHAGKSSLLRQLMHRLASEAGVRADRILYFDFDDVLGRIEMDAESRSLRKAIEQKTGQPIESLDAPIYLFFDEIQAMPRFLPVLSDLLKLNRSRIKMVVASSVSIPKKELAQTGLKDDIRVLYLPFLSSTELINERVLPLGDESALAAILRGKLSTSYFNDLQALVKNSRSEIERIFSEQLVFGGMPAVFDEDDPSRRWQLLQHSLRDYFEKEFHSMAQIADLRKYNQILKILSAHNGEIYNILNICDDFGLNRNTVRKYVGMMQETYVLDFVPPHLEDDVKKVVMRTPKLFFQNNGWVNYWGNYRDLETLRQTSHLQSALDAVLFQNLNYHVRLTSESIQIRFLKDYQNHSLDFLIWRESSLIPVGICHDAEAQKIKIHNFRYFLKYCSQISQGVLFGKFDTIDVKEIRGSTLFLLPLWLLW